MPDNEQAQGDPRQEQESQDQQSEELQAAGKAALEAERKARKEAEKQLKELQAWRKQVEDRDKTETERLAGERDSIVQERDALKSAAEEWQGKYTGLLVKLDFMDKAGKEAGVKPSSLSTAYNVALATGLLGEAGQDGKISPHNFKRLREENPDLFAPGPNGQGDTAAGRNGSPAPEVGMGLSRLQYAYEQSSRR